MAGQKLRGLVGQGMDGRRRAGGLPSEVIAPVVLTGGSGSVVAPKKCIALIHAWGAGGSGANIDFGAGGGGGGAAVFKRVRLVAGQSLAYVIGVGGSGVSTGDGIAGSDTTLALPSGLVLRAGGGKGGTGIGEGAGGMPTNGDINRLGGAGGGIVGTAGQTPLGGGAGGGGASSFFGGGAGAAGFSDIDPSFIGGGGSAASGAGSGTTAGASPGGGSGATYTAGIGVTGSGGSGKIVIVLLRIM